MQTGEDAYIYLTFKVRTDDNGRIILDDANSLKYNIAEINGYKNYYKSGTVLPNYGAISGDSTPAGIIDENSTPGNLKASDLTGEKYEQNFEDDTDRAKGLQVHLNSTERELNGTVWEDKRTISNSQTGNALIGNGIYDTGESGVENIKVEMYEVVNGKASDTPAKIFDGTNWVDSTFVTDSNGNYNIKGYIPGDYIIRFTYPNGNDYKSTLYQVGMAQPGTDARQDDAEGKQVPGFEDYEKQSESVTYGYNIALGETDTRRVSDAKDIWSVRQAINDYGNNYGNSVTYNQYAKELINLSNPKVNMIAETGVIRMEVEYNREISDSAQNTAYNISNVDFGIVERPKAGLKLNKKVSNLKIILSDRRVMFDSAEKSANNLIWTPKGDALFGGLIQVIVDEELMYGANIQITYEFQAENTGEIDYKDQKFYYTGIEDNVEANIVRTSIDKVVDYVSNNIQFRESDNSGIWKVDKDVEVADEIKEKLSKYNTIITTESLKQGLEPGQTSDPVKLVLSQLITSRDNYSYTNIAEVISYSNDVGRRMQTSADPGKTGTPILPGNQDPEINPTEQDASASENISIIPPYGRPYLYFGLGIGIVGMLIVAIILIKKKVLIK